MKFSSLILLDVSGLLLRSCEKPPGGGQRTRHQLRCGRCQLIKIRSHGVKGLLSFMVMRIQEAVVTRMTGGGCSCSRCRRSCGRGRMRVVMHCPDGGSDMTGSRRPGMTCMVTCMMTGMVVGVTIVVDPDPATAPARSRRVVVVVAAAVVVVVCIVLLSLAILFALHPSILKPDLDLTFG